MYLKWSCICGWLGVSVLQAAVPAIDLADSVQRAAQPSFKAISHTCSVADGEWARGRWAYHFQVTKPWIGNLPQWPSVDLKPKVTDWRGYDRLVVDVYNDSIGGDVLNAYLSAPTGRLQNGLLISGLPLRDYGYSRWVLPLKWQKGQDPANIGRVHFFMTTPTSANLYFSGFELLKPGEKAPSVSERFMAEKVRPGEERARRLKHEKRQMTLTNFIAQCKAIGQTGKPAWFGKATSMTKIRPRDEANVQAADSFGLKLARNEYESLQVVVLPNGSTLKNVRVEVLDLCRTRTTFADYFRARETLPTAAFKCSPVGYVETVNPPPYRGGENVATNLPGGYWRQTKTLQTGWWPDPILDYLTCADIADEDMQAFWVRCKCPVQQKAGVYTGELRVTGEGWSQAFPFTVRVYDFTVPKKTPLPLAITFSPGPHLQYATEADLALADRLHKDPNSPINMWRKHKLEWGNFLADYYMTMDSLYHDGSNVHWDVLENLQKQGRLGVFNLGYWSYPHDMKPETLDAWRKHQLTRFKAPYEKAKKLGLLEHAYLYGCDEISPKFFPNIKWALAELHKAYPEVPLFTTAYDHDFGVGSDLAQMNWFTPTTKMYAQNFDKIAPSRATGHQVWWYIACGPHAPFANLFVEYQAIAARQLMGAQTVKWRPQGFLYYQTSIWNSLKCIDGPSTFTDWEPRSWTRYHGDGSWFCCGPDGRPCATIRMENFRDGLEDLAYAQEYERRTGRTCDVPPEVCRAIDQFTDDPAVYYAWRDQIAEAIEREVPATAPLAAIRTVPHELDVLLESGHIQGAACSEEGVYLAHQLGIDLIGWDGRKKRSIRVPAHLGDIAYADGKVYGAFVLRGKLRGDKPGMLRVWDAQLKPLAERRFTEALDGIVVLGDTIYTGVDKYGAKEHPGCCVKRLDLMLNDLGNVDIDLGYDINYGVQTMATDGKDLFFGNYGGTSRVTADLKSNVRLQLGCSEGFGLVPQSVSKRSAPVFFVVRALGGNMQGWRKDPKNNPPQIEIRFYVYADGRFTDISSK